MVKNITFLSHSSDSSGGAESALIELILYLHKRKLIVANVIIPKRGNIEKIFNKNNIKYKIISYTQWADEKQLSGKETFSRDIVNISSLSQIKDYVEQSNSDILFTNTLTAPWMAIVASELKKPHIWMIHEFGDEDHGYIFDYNYKSILQIIDHLSSNIIVNSKAVGAHISKYVDPKKITQVYYSINDIKVNKSKAKENIFNDKDSLKCIIVGRILPSKGQLEAVSAISEAVKKGANIELIIMGSVQSAEYLNKIHNKINDKGLTNRVKIIGYKSNPGDYMNAADVLLMCSKNEAFGRVTAEAMELGKVVVGSDSGATSEIINEMETGLLYKPSDIIELSDKLLLLNDNKHLIDEIGNKAKLFVKNNFNHESYEMAILKVINSELKSSNFPFVDKFINYISLKSKIEKQKNISILKLEKQIYELEITNELLMEKEKELIAIHQSKSYKLTKGIQKICRKTKHPLS
jgi:glycosyltransferase involved in cell wall biosynthesis